MMTGMGTPKNHKSMERMVSPFLGFVGVVWGGTQNRNETHDANRVLHWVLLYLRYTP